MKNTTYAMDTHFMCANTGPDPLAQARLVAAAGYDDYYVTSSLRETDKSLAYAQASRAAGLGFNAVFILLDAAASPGPEDLASFRRLLEGIAPPTRIEFSVLYRAFGERAGDPGTDPGTLAWLRALLPLLEEKGLRACLYPHFAYCLETFADALRLAAALPHPLLGVQFCGYHWYRADRSPLRGLFDRAGDKLFGVNLCGSTFVGPGKEVNGLDPLIQPLDEGEMDNAGVIALLRDIGYAGPIGIQGYGVTAPAADALRRSRQALRKLMA